MKKACAVGAALGALLALVVVIKPGRADPAPLKVLVVGDSISAGCPGGAWCGYLKQHLVAAGQEVQIKTYAYAGWSCARLAGDGFRAKVDAFKPDLTMINCGTNDPAGTQAEKDLLGEKWRTMVEYAYTHGSSQSRILPFFIQYSNPEIQAATGRGWLVPNEAGANDAIWVNSILYPSWLFPGFVNLQAVPGNWDYLNGGTDGIHPNELGNRVYAALVYRAVREYYGLPDSVPQPCGMWGHKPNHEALDHVPCTSMS